ncbi:MAG TPA: serine hydrolase [Clostridia bacterium]|nr:serine hydrolase [Clostridia bacterium]
MRRYPRNVAILILVLFFSLGTLAQSAPPDIDAWVARTMKEFEVPGIALAIVKDGKIVLAKGYGVRRLGLPEPVDANTLFGIASNSKAFTAADVAILVDEQKVSWDDPVIKHLPAFRVDDAFVTSELMVRDLLSHRSGLGLGAGDLMFWPDTDFTREQVVAAAAHIKPVSSLRSRYAYNNLMFIVAGELVAAVSGKSWDDFTRERIFQPLGMNSTVISSASFKPGDNFATPHSRGWRLAGKPVAPIALTKDDTWAAAAGIKSNVTDLSKWVLVQLNRGKIEGDRRLFSEAAQRQMWSMQISTGPGRPQQGPLKSLEAKFSGYGMGWSLRDYQGRKIVSHGGALTGMLSSVYLVPEENLGIIVLTNQEESGSYASIIYHILDHYMKLPATNWISAFQTSRRETLAKAAEAEKKQNEERVKESRPSFPLASYAGDYNDPWYGKATLKLENDRLVLRMTHTPDMVADLEHWQFNTFKAVFRDATIPDAFLTFNLQPDGKIDEMKMVPTSQIADFSFDYQDLLFKPVALPKEAGGK